MKLFPFIFWFSLTFVIYTYIIYPLVISCLAFVKKRKPLKGSHTPSVSFLVIAYNEEKVIRDKVMNCLELDYPNDKIEFVFVSSGSTDDTAKIVSSFQEKKIKLIVLNDNKGKSFAINQIAPKLESNLIIFSDARQMFDRNSVKELTANFNDPSVGCASGELVFLSNKNKKEIKGISLYWSYEKFLRQQESNIHSSLGTTGAIYAIRKELFEPFPDNTILDDFVIPMNIIKQGYRVVFDRKAKAKDFISETFAQEFKRKVRTLSGNYQAFVNLPFLFNFKNNPVFFQVISHKIFRLLIPFFLLLLFLTNMLLNANFYKIFFCFQIVFYLSGLVGLKYKTGIFGFLGTFVVLNFAAAVGLFNYLLKPLSGVWRESESDCAKRIGIFRFFTIGLIIVLSVPFFSAVFKLHGQHEALIAVIKLLFWFVICILLYAYIGYPCLMLFLALLFTKNINKKNIEPMVSIIITAYNEEKNIKAKLKNTLALDYDKDKLEIIVASDGSTDGTDNIVKKFCEGEVKLIRVKGRVGKTETQNQAVRKANGEILIFSDAASFYKTDAIKKIVRNFYDPNVGGVAGKCQYVKPIAGGPTSLPTKLYWWYETILKKCQSHLWSITGASGLIYAIRKDLYVSLPQQIISDMVEPMMIVKQNKRFVYEPEAISYEKTTSEFKQEFNMRVRVISRGMIGIIYMRSLLNPLRHCWFSFQLFSHKILRWFIPIYLISIFITNLFLLSGKLYLFLFIVQLMFYSSILFAYRFPLGKNSSLFQILIYFCILTSASLAAFVKVLTGETSITWETER